MYRQILNSLAIAGVLSAGAPANALLLGPGDEIATSTDNTAFTTWAEVETGYSIDWPTDLDDVFKADVGDQNNPATVYSGSFAASYEATFGPDALDPENSLIEWISGQPSIDCDGAQSCALIVKDGNHDPAQYLFDISQWNGTDSIELTGFWPNQGAISHVSIWAGEGSDVPAPGTLLLMGLGLLGLARSLRRS